MNETLHGFLDFSCVFEVNFLFAELISPSHNHIFLLILSFLLCINSLLLILACLNLFSSEIPTIAEGFHCQILYITSFQVGS